MCPPGALGGEVQGGQRGDQAELPAQQAGAGDECPAGTYAGQLPGSGGPGTEAQREGVNHGVTNKKNLLH